MYNQYYPNPPEQPPPPRVFGKKLFRYRVPLNHLGFSKTGTSAEQKKLNRLSLPADFSGFNKPAIAENNFKRQSLPADFYTGPQPVMYGPPPGRVGQGGQMGSEEDGVDYTFSRMSVRERTKLFQGDEPARTISQYGTLPRGPMARPRTRYGSQSVDNEVWQSPVRPTWIGQTSTVPRRPASYDYGSPGQTISSSRTMELQTMQRQSSQYIQPSYAPRQSRTMYRPPPPQAHFSQPMVVQAGDQPLLYQPVSAVSPGTRVIRRASYSVGPSHNRQRDTVSMSREIWPTATRSQYGQPLRVTVYNSDRSVSSPGHSQSAFWGKTASPAYPAYPATRSKMSTDGTQIYRVVQSPSRAPISSSFDYPRKNQPMTEIYVPLAQSHRRTISSPQYEQKSITIHPQTPQPYPHVYQQPYVQYQSPDKTRQSHPPGFHPAVQPTYQKVQLASPRPPNAAHSPSGRSDWTVLQPTRISHTFTAPVQPNTPAQSRVSLSPTRPAHQKFHPQPNQQQLYHQPQPQQFQPWNKRPQSPVGQFFGKRPSSHHVNPQGQPRPPRIVNHRSPTPDEHRGVTEF